MINYVKLCTYISQHHLPETHERWLMCALPGGFNSASQPVGWASACASMLPCPAGRSWGRSPDFTDSP